MVHSTSDIISCFEAEQRNTVFSALSEYLSTGQYVDISLVCKGQVLRAHKVVLSSSSKYFKDFFRHQPGVNIIDLDKELAPNDLSLTLEDVQLIIGILYCVGTVEISPARIETLLICAQVLGIPTLISFLKKIRDSINDNSKILKEPPQRLEYNERPGPSLPMISPHHKILAPAASARPFVAGTSVTQRRNSSDMMYLLSGAGSAPASHTFQAQPAPASMFSGPGSSTRRPLAGPPSSFSPYSRSDTPSPRSPLLDLSVVKPMTASCVNSPAPPENGESSEPSPIPGPSGLQQRPRTSTGPRSVSFGDRVCGGGGVQDSLLSANMTKVDPEAIYRRESSRISTASYSSFTLNYLQSPRLKSTENPGSENQPSLDGFDQNFFISLNTLQANQIDDLENVLLPHLSMDGRSDNPLLDLNSIDDVGENHEEEQNISTTSPDEGTDGADKSFEDQDCHDTSANNQEADQENNDHMQDDNVDESSNAESESEEEDGSELILNSSNNVTDDTPSKPVEVENNQVVQTEMEATNQDESQPKSISVPEAQDESTKDKFTNVSDDPKPCKRLRLVSPSPSMARLAEDISSPCPQPPMNPSLHEDHVHPSPRLHEDYVSSSPRLPEEPNSSPRLHEELNPSPRLHEEHVNTSPRLHGEHVKLSCWPQEHVSSPSPSPHKNLVNTRPRGLEDVVSPGPRLQENLVNPSPRPRENQILDNLSMTSPIHYSRSVTPVRMRPGTSGRDMSAAPVRLTPHGHIALTPIKNLMPEETNNNPEDQNQSDVSVDEQDGGGTHSSGSSSPESPEHSAEIVMNLDKVIEGQRMKFSIPGISQAVTVNFSPEALQEMKNAALSNQINQNVGLVTDSDNNQYSEITSSDKSKESESQLSNKMSKKKNNKKNLRQKLKSNLKSPLKLAKDEENFAKPLNYLCPICNKTFPSVAQLEKHQKFHVQKCFSCKECHEIFDKKWLYDQHLADKHGHQLEKSVCPECNKEFSQRNLLLAHIQAHHKKKSEFKCFVCNLNFNKKHNLVTHLNSWHPNEKFPYCPVCMEIFSDKKAMDNHECPGAEIKNGAIICHLHEAPIRFTSRVELENHMKEKHGSTEDNFNITCCICQKKFLLRNNLEKHLRNVHNQGEGIKHFCPTCGKQFYDKNDLKNHMPVHAGEFNFKCSEVNCDKAYSTLKALRKHNKLSHQVDIESVTCKVCNKRLATKYKLKAHMLVHSDAKPFSCTHCSDTFKERRNVIKHIKLKHIKANAAKAVKNVAKLALVKNNDKESERNDVIQDIISDDLVVNPNVPNMNIISSKDFDDQPDSTDPNQ